MQEFAARPALQSALPQDESIGIESRKASPGDSLPETRLSPVATVGRQQRRSRGRILVFVAGHLGEALAPYAARFERV